MALPYFYMEQLKAGSDLVELEEDTSRHVVQVLRMQAGDQLQVTDGKGNLYTALIQQIHKRSTQVKILGSTCLPPPSRKVSIAISLVKNASRFEWFLEKATEIGVHNITPLICERTEKHHFRFDRMQNILVSAMLQSQQCWLPKLSEPVPLSEYLHQTEVGQKFIAHCADGDKRSLRNANDFNQDAIMLIGPEGDFSQQEINHALELNFIPVTLGNTRLRTETAGIVAACLLLND